MKNKIYLSICLSICLLFVFSVPSFALTATTNSDLVGSSSQVNNLLSLLPDRFSGKYDYVVFTDSDYSYYVFFGNSFTVNGNRITASDCDYIHYYRSGSLSSYQYVYDFGTQNLNLTVNKLIASNLDIDRASNNWSYDEYQNNNILYLGVIIIAVFIIFNTLRGWLGGRIF